MPVSRGRDGVGDRRGDGVRAQEPIRVVLAVLEGHQLALHVGVGAAGIDGGDP